MQSSITTAPYRHHARVELAAPLAELDRSRAADRRRAGTRSTTQHTLLTTGADDLDLLAFHLLGLGVDFRVVETDALRAAPRTAAERLANAVGAPR